MTNKVEGIPLSRFEEPTQVALLRYQEIANNGLEFDINGACMLNATPEKPNSARSETPATLRGENIGRLFVIAFKYGDGTGNNGDYQFGKIHVASAYPRANLVIPRRKTGVYEEVHLAIASHEVNSPHAEPELFKGTFDLLGMKKSMIQKIGELGQILDTDVLEPVATYTVGFRNLRRFGDPHAVFSSKPELQVCAFLAISEEINRKYPHILDNLNPRHPII
ncbi:MAG: hypothetical protein PHQ59_04040 [Candidatus Daviesbacteria bacterium]|nr:hypothetical protein [Candidatus Daviesbacteria bacterium]